MSNEQLDETMVLTKIKGILGENNNCFPSERELIKKGQLNLISGIKKHFGSYRELRKKLGVYEKITEYFPGYFDNVGEWQNFEPSVLREVQSNDKGVSVTLDYRVWIPQADIWMKWQDFAEGKIKEITSTEKDIIPFGEVEKSRILSKGIPDVVLVNFYNDLQYALDNTEPNFSGFDIDKLWEKNEIPIKELGLNLSLSYKCLSTLHHIGKLDILVKEEEQVSIDPWPPKEFIEEYSSHLEAALGGEDE